MTLRLLDLEPEFLAWDDDTHWHYVGSRKEAVGVQFVCPLCFENAERVRPGVHSVVCWDPSVPQTTSPGPGRWTMQGEGLEDLTLVAGSSSILLTGGCNAHFFIQNGLIVFTAPFPKGQQ